MSERKNSKSRRNYLVKCSCPNCTQESEHSFSSLPPAAGERQERLRMADYACFLVPVPPALEDYEISVWIHGPA